MRSWAERIPAPLPEGTDVPSIYRLYLTQLERRRSRSLPDAQSVARIYILDAFADRRVTELRVPHIAAWVATLVALGLAPKYVRKIHAFLRGALDVARVHGLIAENPAKLPPGILPRNETRPGFDAAAELLTLEELRALLSDQRLPLYRRLLWALLALCGMRLGEALALTYADVDFRARPLWRITIARAWNSKSRRFEPTKTNDVRLGPVHAGLLAPLIAEMRESGFRALHGRAPKSSDLLIAHPDHKSGLPTIYPDNSALRHFKAALTLHGLSPRRQHSLRHFFDTALSEAGADERAIEQITHPPKKQRKGVRRYVHASYQARCDAVSKLQGNLQMDLFKGK